MQEAVKKLPKGDEFRFKKEEFQHGDTLGRQKGTHSRKISQRRETGTQEHTLREAILETKGSPERTPKKTYFQGAFWTALAPEIPQNAFRNGLEIKPKNEEKTGDFREAVFH